MDGQFSLVKNVVRYIRQLYSMFQIHGEWNSLKESIHYKRARYNACLTVF